MALLLIPLAGLVLLAGLGWVIAQAIAQQSRLSDRIDDLTAALARGIEPDRSPVLDALKGERAPGFSLLDLSGSTHTIDSLIHPERPLLLIFAEPRCGPCYELLPDIAGWQRLYGDRLTVALISTGEVATNRAMTAEFGIERVLLQRDMELVHAYNLKQAPAGVLVRGDGRIAAGPRYGSTAIRELVADTLGLQLPPAPVKAVTAIQIGEPAPALRLPDLHGRLVDLRAYRGSAVMLLFWSPGCSHCQSLLPELQAYQARANRLPTIVVSRGPVALNLDLGLTLPVVIDEERRIGGPLGVTGTPAAVLIDSNGDLAAPVARGSDGVRQVLARMSAPAVVAAD
jgi:thiol-disulfide isomerase/thioredoxin